MLDAVRRSEKYAYAHRVRLIGVAGLLLVVWQILTGHEQMAGMTGIVQVFLHVLVAREGGPSAGGDA
jgi:hypothetical protein